MLHKPYSLELVEVPKPEPSDNEILVKIAWVGICGSDVEAYKGHRPPELFAGQSRLGHEASGTIEKTGKNVSGLKEGDSVVIRGTWGCFAEYVTTDPLRAKKLPPEISLIEGSIIEVLPCIIKICERAEITPETDVLILGQGVSGLLLTQIARLYKPQRLVTTDLFEEKLELSKELGATDTLRATGDNKEDVRRIKGLLQKGADVVILANLGGQGVETAIDAVKTGGRIMLYGNLDEASNINFYKLHAKCSDLLTTRLHYDASLVEFRRTFDLATEYVLEGIVNASRLITHKFPLTKLKEAFRLKERPRGDVIHIMVKCERPWELT